MAILEENSVETFRKIQDVIQTNFTGLVHCTQKGFRLIDKSGDYGIIINIGSIAGHSIPFAEFNFNVYPGTKFAVNRSLAVL